MGWVCTRDDDNAKSPLTAHRSVETRARFGRHRSRCYRQTWSTRLRARVKRARARAAARGAQPVWPALASARKRKSRFCAKTAARARLRSTIRGVWALAPHLLRHDIKRRTSRRNRDLKATQSSVDQTQTIATNMRPPSLPPLPHRAVQRAVQHQDARVDVARKAIVERVERITEHLLLLDEQAPHLARAHHNVGRRQAAQRESK